MDRDSFLNMHGPGSMQGEGTERSCPQALCSPWRWVIDEEADGVLYCTMQMTGTGRKESGEEHRGAHLIQPGKQVEPGVGEDIPTERAVAVWLDQRGEVTGGEMEDEASGNHEGSSHPRRGAHSYSEQKGRLITLTRSASGLGASTKFPAFHCGSVPRLPPHHSKR